MSTSYTLVSSEVELIGPELLDRVAPTPKMFLAFAGAPNEYRPSV